ncbi:hypothetical protein J5N97_022291 [Dioscorea zingiberensis]|uniref:Amino acid transporter transmembrane domain-containing protein n=1 Tax=Dioscorea zingiberensis TaxID=325984 RepID=A0A9D5CAP1_9LILI|nr:hypothetical protein J5N97_022291 [Dioscorea zingiberensis]
MEMKGMAEGDHERQGTVWTATAHIVTAVIGSGVLALPWSVAQLGWTMGPIALVGFSFVTYYTSLLLADCYRSPDPITGKRNQTYMDAVRSHLGMKTLTLNNKYVFVWEGQFIKHLVCIQGQGNAVKRSVHRNGAGEQCRSQGISEMMVVVGLVEVVLSQLPNMEKITWVSVTAAVMSFAYSFIALALCIAWWALHGWSHGGGTQHVGVPPPPPSTRLGTLSSLWDTIKSPPPENKTMKRATLYGIGLTSIFYISLGCIGYAAFGDESPGNILTGSLEPFWLVDIANLCIVIHLIGAYQVFAQPIFANLEGWIARRWPESRFIHKVYNIRVPFMESGARFALSKLVFRSVFVVLTTFLAMLVPFFNAILGLLGAVSFWPLTVYFPVSMHIAQAEIRPGTRRWMLLHGLSVFCLIISLFACIGSVANIIDSLKMAAPFKLV